MRELGGPRLHLVLAGESDLDFLARLNADATVMRHVSGRAMSRAETQMEWRARLGARSDAERGLGYWIGRLGDEPVGWWGLGVDRRRSHAGELGFRLGRAHWRWGLATEGARLVMDHGFHTVKLGAIWAGTTAGNAASRATLTKLGLSCVDEPWPGTLTYEIEREEWLATRGGAQAAGA